MSQVYRCTIEPEDKLEVASFFSTLKQEKVIAFSSTHYDGRSACIMLSRDQAIELGNQIQDFIINGCKP